MPVDPKKKEVRHLKLKVLDEDDEIKDGLKYKNVDEGKSVRDGLKYRNVNEDKEEPKPLTLPPVAKTGAGKSPSDYEAEKDNDDEDPKKKMVKGDNKARKHYGKQDVNLKRLFGFE